MPRGAGSMVFVLLECEVWSQLTLMEPSDEDQEIKAERNGALGTRLMELGLDL